jgi:hypothetical protein
MNWISRALAAALIAAALTLIPTSAFATDTDHDGLPDAWERGSTPQGLNLKTLGAKPKHRDVFVEMSYSWRSGKTYLPCSELDRLYRAFAQAPLKNPDGTTGVRLHIDADKTCPSRKYDLGGSSRFTVSYKPGQGLCANPTDMGNVLGAKRLNVFHIGGMVAPNELCGPEGFATQTDFIVKDSRGFEFAFVGLHELGHIFGLDHEPFNGFSVMGGGLWPYVSSGSGSSTSSVDFTRFPINALDETNLNEHVGYSSPVAAGNTWLSRWFGPQYCDSDSDPATPPERKSLGPAHGDIDLDCSGSPWWIPPYDDYISDTPVSYDVNGDGVFGTVPGVAAEWPRLRFGMGRIGP